MKEKIKVNFESFEGTFGWLFSRYSFTEESVQGFEWVSEEEFRATVKAVIPEHQESFNGDEIPNGWEIIESNLISRLVFSNDLAVICKVPAKEVTLQITIVKVTDCIPSDEEIPEGSEFIEEKYGYKYFSCWRGYVEEK